jgi:hypothetical protein
MQYFQVMIEANRPPLRLRQPRPNTLSQRRCSLTSYDRREGMCTMQCGSRPNNYALLPRVTEKTQGGDEARTLGEPAPWRGEAGTRAYQCVPVAWCGKTFKT